MAAKALGINSTFPQKYSCQKLIHNQSVMALQKVLKNTVMLLSDLVKVSKRKLLSPGKSIRGSNLNGKSKLSNINKPKLYPVYISSKPVSRSNHLI